VWSSLDGIVADDGLRDDAGRLRNCRLYRRGWFHQVVQAQASGPEVSVEPVYKSSSDVAADLLRQAFERRGKCPPGEVTFLEKAINALKATFPRGMARSGRHAKRSSALRHWRLSRSLQAMRTGPWWSFWPICRLDQSVFAETFRAGMTEGLAVADAVEVALAVNRCVTFRLALIRFCSEVRAGYPLGASMRRSGAWVDPGLLAALEIGQEYDCLNDELLAFVRRDRWFTPALYCKAIGRRPETVNFAAALSRLLREHSLTGRLVLAAGRLSGSRGDRFLRVVEEVVEDMEDGLTFTDALSRHPRYFDVVFCRFLESKQSRDEIRECLARLAAAGNVIDSEKTGKLTVIP
jgi:hypothetical protein